jgi:hypothetical protein
VDMKCLINQNLVDCKVVEDLGYQGGKYAKVVLYEDQEVVVVKAGGRWIKHNPDIQPTGCYTGQGRFPR